MKYLLFVCLLLALVGCTGVNEIPPAGSYLVIPVTETFAAPDFCYQSAGQQWCAKMAEFTPTPENFVTATPDDYLTLTAYPIPTPLPTLALPSPTAIQPLYVCPNGDYINVRQSPTTSSAILGQLSQGQRALVLTIYGDWTQVRYKTQVGYVYTQYVHNCVDGVLQ